MSIEPVSRISEHATCLAPEHEVDLRRSRLSERVWKCLALWAIRRLRKRLEHRIDGRFDATLSLELDRLAVADETLKL